LIRNWKSISFQSLAILLAATYPSQTENRRCSNVKIHALFLLSKFVTFAFIPVNFGGGLGDLLQLTSTKINNILPGSLLLSYEIL